MIWVDPVAQAEAIERKWDVRVRNLPICDRCGKPIADPMLVHIPYHEEYFCMDCIDAMVEFNEEAEVE